MSDLAIQDDMKPAKTNALEAANPEFEGLGVGGWAKRVVFDGKEIVYKDRETNNTFESITIRLTGGRNVHQWFDEGTNTFHKSYDGKFTTDGDPISKYPGMRLMYEIDWTELVDGEELEHQMVLSPTSRYPFIDYVQALTKKFDPPKKLTEVDTIITVLRGENKDKKKYSYGQFTCPELQAMGWTPPAKKK